jgi:RNA polymerase sigma-70 factor (ECF subfamily)
VDRSGTAVTNELSLTLDGAAGSDEIAGEAHRKNYLFRIAANLVRDQFRRSKPAPATRSGKEEEPGRDAEDRLHLRSDLARTLQELKPRERDLLWLAYVEGSRHTEIAEALGLKAQSIRPMLFRARQKLAGLLRKRGFTPGTSRG